MRNWKWVMIFIVLQGCAVAVEEKPSANTPARMSAGEAKAPLTAIDEVRVGMGYAAVSTLMNVDILVGYVKKASPEEGFERVTVRNPYRQEELTSDSQVYRIYYYFTHVANPDGHIADDELTPVVFLKDVVAGKGWDYLFQLRAKLSS